MLRERGQLLTARYLVGGDAIGYGTGIEWPNGRDVACALWLGPTVEPGHAVWTVFIKYWPILHTSSIWRKCACATSSLSWHESTVNLWSISLAAINVSASDPLVAIESNYRQVMRTNKQASHNHHMSRLHSNTHTHILYSCDKIVRLYTR